MPTTHRQPSNCWPMRAMPLGFRTNVVADTAWDMELLQLIESYFADIGIDMEIRPMESAACVLLWKPVSMTNCPIAQTDRLVILHPAPSGISRGFRREHHKTIKWLVILCLTSSVLRLSLLKVWTRYCGYIETQTSMSPENTIRYHYFSHWHIRSVSRG